jgi:hypothetical protein
MWGLMYAITVFQGEGDNGFLMLALINLILAEQYGIKSQLNKKEIENRSRIR